MPRGRGRGRPRKPRLGRIDAAVDAMAQLGFPAEKVKSVVKQLLEEYGGDDGWHFIEDCAYMELINAILRDVHGVEKDNGAEGDDDNDVNNAAEDDNDIGGNQSEDMSIDDEGAASGTSNTAIQQATPTPHAYLPSSDVLETPTSVAEQEASCSDVVSCSSAIHNEVGESIAIPPEEAWKDIVQDHKSEQVFMESDKAKHGNEEVSVSKAQSPQRNSEPVTPLPANEEVSVSKVQSSQRNSEPVTLLPANLPPPPPRNCRLAPRRRPCYGWIDSDEEGEEDPKKFICLTPASEKVEKKSTFLGGTQSKLKRKSRWDQDPWDC